MSLAEVVAVTGKWSPSRLDNAPAAAGVTALAALHERHAEVAGRGCPPAAALAALAVGHVLTEALMTARWPLANTALVGGATLEQMAEAMDLTTAEVEFGLVSFAPELGSDARDDSTRPV